MSLADRIVVMADGEIRQIGTPSEVYNTPTDLFVANFVGSPGMNLLTGKIVQADQNVVFTNDEADTHIPLSHPLEPAPAILGIRPEFIRPSTTGLQARVMLSEYQGSHRYVHLDSPLGNLIMRTEAALHFNAKETLCLQFDPEHICLFNPQTERAF
ncbi:MAG: TOBE domain-containing protein, partial [Candidatus Latescibacteria bacterium]|nr:TOBE domain-containing protein [Candidatus Latescibacterota bacterium]